MPDRHLPATAAERMQLLRDEGRRIAARHVATAITTFQFGVEATPGLEEDLFGSRLSLTDLEELAAVVLDHARGEAPEISHAASNEGPAPEPARTSTPQLQSEDVGGRSSHSSAGQARKRRGEPLGLRRAVWKFNVSPKNLAVCVDHSMFADNQQRNLAAGDLILLQQIKGPNTDSGRRITHVMEFQRYERDATDRSAQLWGKKFTWLMHGRMHELPSPFSLEDLSLTKSYSQQGKISPERVAAEDEPQVLAAVGKLTYGT